MNAAVRRVVGPGFFSDAHVANRNPTNPDVVRGATTLMENRHHEVHITLVQEQERSRKRANDGEMARLWSQSAVADLIRDWRESWLGLQVEALSASKDCAARDVDATQERLRT